jgi:hypothetical protein
VKLQIEEYAKTEGADLAYSFRPHSREKVDIDLEHADEFGNFAGHVTRFLKARIIESEDDLAAGSDVYGRAGASSSSTITRPTPRSSSPSREATR